MWQTDTVTLQTKTEVNTNGAIKATWSDLTTVLCDVQDINKEKVHKSFGLTDANEFKQVFDRTLSSGWVEGNQVSYDSKKWLIRLVDNSETKIGLSNHKYIILSRVIGQIDLPWILVGGIWNDNGIWIDSEVFIID